MTSANLEPGAQVDGRRQVDRDLSLLMEASLTGVIATDQSGLITDWNHSAEEIFGWTAAEAMGRGLAATLVPQRLRGHDEAALSWFLATGDNDVAGIVSAPAVHRDGHEIDIELTMSPPVQTRGGLRLIAFVRDVTRRRQAERLQAAQLAVGRVLTESESTEEASGEVLRQVGEKLELAVGRLLTWDEEGLVVSRTWLAEGAGERERSFASDPRWLHAAPGQGPAGRAATSGEPQLVRSEDCLPLPAGFALPISDGAHVVAVMELFHGDQARQDDRAQLASLGELGRQLGQFVGRRQAEAELREIFDFSPIGLARVGLDGSVLTANRALARLLSRRQEDMTGAHFREVTVPDDVEATESVYRALAAGRQESIELEKRYRRGERDSFWGCLTASTVKDALGRPRYFVAAVQDIEGRKQAEAMQAAGMAAQEAAIQELERVNRLKSDFVSVVSHEFRTALMGIQGFSELLRDQDLTSSEVRAYAGDVNTDARRLGRLINDMLELDRMESGRLSLSLESTDLNRLAAEAVDRARVLSRKHSFELSLDPALPEVQGDRDRLTQVLSNLLSNAVKYSPEGGAIELRTQAGPEAAAVFVSDHGVGIPAAALDQVFERFARVEQSATRQVGGTGLGLAIVKEIVELHGGRVEVESQPGEGSTFQFTIPLGAGARQPAGSAEPGTVAAGETKGARDGR